MEATEATTDSVLGRFPQSTLSWGCLESRTASRRRIPAEAGRVQSLEAPWLWLGDVEVWGEEEDDAVVEPSSSFTGGNLVAQFEATVKGEEFLLPVGDGEEDFLPPTELDLDASREACRLPPATKCSGSALVEDIFLPLSPVGGFSAGKPSMNTASFEGCLKKDASTVVLDAEEGLDSFLASAQLWIEGRRS